MDIHQYVCVYQRRGRKLWITINGESMSPIMKNGEKVHIQFEQRTPRLGDIILFYAKNRYVIHRVVKLLNNHLFITKGDANYMLDDVFISQESIVGFVDMECKAYLFISWATRLSYWQGKLFCHVLNKRNNKWMKSTINFCTHCQHLYQYILQHCQIILKKEKLLDESIG